MAIENSAGAESDLAALLQALDVKNLAGALAQLKTLKDIQTKLNEVMPKYEAAQQEIAKIDEADALEDVGMALASLGIDPNDQSKSAVHASLLRDRKANRDKFRADYKIEEARKLARARNAATVATTGGADPTVALVTQREHATHQPSILDSLALGANGVVRRSAPVVEDKPGTSARVDLSTFPGANDVQRAMAYVKSQPGGDKLNLDALHERACLVLRSARAA
jgi:hypothetical protein